MQNVNPDTVIYLGILLVLLVISYLLARRTNIAQVLRHATIWVTIFAGVFWAMGVWPEVRAMFFDGRASISQDGVELRVRQALDSHYYLNLEVNGVPIRFVVDTGATDIVLRREDAAAVGIDLDSVVFLGRAQTANGVVETARIRLDTIGLESMIDRDVRAVINGGELHESLLGMGYLNRFGTVLIQDGELILRR